jgi:hypothetical protein
VSDGSTLFQFWNTTTGDNFELLMDGVLFGLIPQADIIIWRAFTLHANLGSPLVSPFCARRDLSVPFVHSFSTPAQHLCSVKH